MPQRALQQQVENKHTIELDARIEAYRTRKGELSIQYTDKHPEIQAIKEAIELLEKRRDKELAKLQQKQEQLQREDGSTGGAGVELQQNPVYQSMKIAFNAAEIEVAALTAEMNAISDGVAELQRMVNIIPQVEANLGRLNRDYAIVKEKFNGLLQRLETAKLSRRAEQSGENIEFQVIDPPTLPDRPSKPNRMLLNSLVVAASFVAGGALTFALHLLFPVFGDARTLGNSVGFPVLGVVSLKRGRAQKIQSVVGCIAVASAALLLLVVAAGIITYEEKARSAFQSLIRLI
jgi:polysaccharide chain length determinant protein (PEP-CTERM system associated)